MLSIVAFSVSEHLDERCERKIKTKLSFPHSRLACFDDFTSNLQEMYAHFQPSIK